MMGDYFDLIREMDAVIGVLERHPDAQTRQRIATLLGGLDSLHREALGRLVTSLREGGAGAVLDAAAERDPVIDVLLGLYDLRPLDLLPEEAPPLPPGVAFLPRERLTVGRRPHPQREGARAPGNGDDQQGGGDMASDGAP